MKIRSFRFSSSILENRIRKISKHPQIEKVLVTGSNGQLSKEMSPYLNLLYGEKNILYTDVGENTNKFAKNFASLDITNADSVLKAVNQSKPHLIINNAAVVSALGEKNYDLAVNVNIRGFLNIIDACKANSIKLFSPSTVAAFGESTPRNNTPNTTIMRPSTIYGVSKVFNELLGEYAKRKDFIPEFRSLRYPSTISVTLNPRASAVYSTEIFYAAIKDKKYKCYLKPNTKLAFIYIDDLIEGTLAFINYHGTKPVESVYNIQSTSFTVSQLASQIRKSIPEFKMKYESDFRQDIVNTWPRSIDDSKAKADWGYDPQYNLENLVKEMLEEVSKINS